MLEKTEVGDGMIAVSDQLIPIRDNEYLVEIFKGDVLTCAVKGCRRRAHGITKVRLVHRGQMMSSSNLYFMPLCRTCHDLKNYHLGQQLWILKEGYPLLITQG